MLINKDASLHITDFGVSQQFKDQNDLTSVKFGTVAYHSPEIYSGEEFSAKATDIWALGCILYQLCTGDLPFKGSNKVKIIENITKQ